MANPVKNVSLFGIVLLHNLIMVVTVFPYWKQSTPKLSDGIYRVWSSWEGIWWRCTAKKSGEMWCDFHKDPLFKLSPELQAFRAMMCFACVMSYIAIVLTILSLDSVTCVQEGTKPKSFMSIVSGALTLGSGTLMALCTSWTGIQVYNEFSNPLFKNRQVGYEFGYCLYFGWVGSLLAAIVGLLMLYVGCTELSEFHKEEQEYTASSYRHTIRQSSLRVKTYADDDTLQPQYV